MTNMEASTHQRLNLLDLPNELLLIIIKYLPTIDALYSLLDLTQRLDQLVLNSISTSTLNITCLRPELLPERVCSLDERALTTLCCTVLPRIQHPISHLIVDQFSLDAVFGAREYPALHFLSLIDMDHDEAFCLFRVDCGFDNFVHRQITSLSIDLSGKWSGEASIVYSSLIFHSILTSCQRLTKLHFCCGSGSQLHRVEFSPFDCQSALLTELSVYTTSFAECVHVFDGRFPSLSTAAIVVQEIGRTESDREQAQRLPNLKRFSLTSQTPTYSFDHLIVPFLRRMINLEELSLSLDIIRSISLGYVDGAQLRHEVLRHMPRMKKFHFSIETTIVEGNIDVVLASNDDIQRSFSGRPFGSVGSHVDVFPQANGTRTHTHIWSHEFYSRCHIYSLPYRFDLVPDLSTSFQGDIFSRVQLVFLLDIRPFEHDFFRLISRSFPALTALHITNDVPQASKQPTNTPIFFPRLRRLGIRSCHVDYAVQFLMDERCQLPRLRDLEIRWPTLVSVTNDFSNAATRRTCSRVKILRMPEACDPPAHFQDYFASS